MSSFVQPSHNRTCVCITLKSCQNLPKADFGVGQHIPDIPGFKDLIGLLPGGSEANSDPYLKFHLLNTKTGKESPIQRSSVIWRNVNPIWNPPEQFVFLLNNITDLEHSRVIVEVVDYDKLSKNDYLGSSVVALKNLNLAIGQGEASHVLKLTDIDSGEILESCKINVGIELKTEREVDAVNYETVFEYERWTPTGGWGKERVGHLLPGDKGVWSTHDKSLWAMTLEEVELDKIGGGDEREWVSDEGWKLETSGAVHVQGWWFSLDMNNREWMSKAGPLHCCRRRKWVRTSHAL